MSTNFIAPFLDFIFPTFCLHCMEKTSGKRLCTLCAEHLLLSSDPSILFDVNLVSSLYIRYVQRHQFLSDIKTVAAYIVLKLDRLENTIPDQIFGKDQLTRAIAKQVLFFYGIKRSNTKKKVLQIQEKRIENQPSIVLLMT